MNRERCEVIWLGASVGARRCLGIAMRAVDMPVTRAELLTAAADYLHRACLHFQKADYASVFEDRYLPLFDALACVNEAQMIPEDGDRFIALALDALDGKLVEGGV